MLNLLLLSGVAFFLAAVYVAFKVPGKFNQTLLRLVDRGTLQTSRTSLAGLESDLKPITRQWALYTGISVALVIFICFLKVYGKEFTGSYHPRTTPLSVRVITMLLEVPAAFIAGSFLGSMASYGKLGLLLRRRQIKIIMQPGHIDGVAGLKPIGEFYFRQAMIVAIPVIFLGIWLLIILFPQPLERYKLWDPDYLLWNNPYRLLFSCAILFELLVFWIPLIYFHQEMKKQKRRYLKDADELSYKICLVQRDLINEQDAIQRELLKDKLSAMKQFYSDIENLRTWPVSLRTRRTITRNNILMMLPLAVNLSNTPIGKAVLQHAKDSLNNLLQTVQQQPKRSEVNASTNYLMSPKEESSVD